MARPKSKQPTKTIVTSIRLTPEERDTLIKQFGSIQGAINNLIRETLSKRK
jgi:hypothetical protein